MASLGHVIVGLAAARLHDNVVQVITPMPRYHRVVVVVAFCCLAMLPDADVIGFRFGVAYASEFGHRGASHSIVAAVVIGLLASLLLAPRSASVWRTSAALAVVVVVSHGLLDCLTDGGEGVALLWPFSEARWFAPWNPIPVAPIGRNFISLRGLTCMATELALFSPFLLYAIFGRRRR